MDVNEITIYKIKRKSDGLYSNGFPRPSFNKNGKIWTKIGALKMHLALQDNIPWRYHDCEVVAYTGIFTVDEEKTKIVQGVTEHYAKNAIMRRLSGKTL